MITARFLGTAEAPRSVEISGHAGYAAHGQDIVCASVTSAVQLTANGISEILGEKAEIAVLEDLISITPEEPSSAATAFLRALQLHLQLLSEEFPGTITLKTSEV